MPAQLQAVERLGDRRQTDRTVWDVAEVGQDPAEGGELNFFYFKKISKKVVEKFI